MRYFLPALLAALLFSGCGLFRGPATQATITAIEVTSFPNSDGGNPWDEDSDPDLTIWITTGANVLYEHDETRANVAQTALPVRFNLAGYRLPDLGQSYEVGLFEMDGTDNEFIGNASFWPQNHTDDRPESIDVAGNAVSYRVFIDWE